MCCNKDENAMSDFARYGYSSITKTSLSCCPKCVISDNSTKSTIDYEARVTLSTYQTILNVINLVTK